MYSPKQYTKLWYFLACHERHRAVLKALAGADELPRNQFREAIPREHLGSLAPTVAMLRKAGFVRVIRAGLNQFLYSINSDIRDTVQKFEGSTQGERAVLSFYHNQREGIKDLIIEVAKRGRFTFSQLLPDLDQDYRDKARGNVRNLLVTGVIDRVGYTAKNLGIYEMEEAACKTVCDHIGLVYNPNQIEAAKGADASPLEKYKDRKASYGFIGKPRAAIGDYICSPRTYRPHKAEGRAVKCKVGKTLTVTVDESLFSREPEQRPDYPSD